MNNNQSSSFKAIFQLLVTIAVVALIFSISRIFLSASDRETTTFFTYNLSYPSQVAAFLSVVIFSTLTIVVGSLISKQYNIFGAPLLTAGILTLGYVTVASYLIRFLYPASGEDAQLGEAVLTITIAIEWLMLVIFTWRLDTETQSLLGINKSKPSQPDSDMTTLPPTSHQN